MENQGGTDVTKKAVFLSAEKVTIGAIVAFLFLLFGGIVVFAGQYGSAPNASPTPVPDGLFQAGAGGQFDAKQPPQQPQAKSAQNQEDYAVKQPSPTPKPTPKPNPTPSPSATVSPTPTPSPSPSPSSTPEPTPNPTNTPSPNPSPTESPSASPSV